jgi:chromosomal replication initiator protein
MQIVAESTVEVPSGWVLLPENRSAWMAVRRLRRNLQTARPVPFPLLYLYGGPGTGKSHLLQYLQDSLPAELTHHCLRAADWPEAPSDELQHCHVLIVEDLQHLPRRTADYVKTVLDSRFARRRATVISALLGPAELENLPAFLANRLAGGLIVGIWQYGPSSRRILLKQLAQVVKHPIRPEVLDWLAQHLPGSGRQLQAALQRVELISAEMPEPVEISALCEIFQTEADQHEITVERIVNQVSHAFQVKAKDIRGSDRQPQMVWSRQVSIYLARKWTCLSLEQIGRYFGGRDHSTVRHACQKVESVIVADAEQFSLLRQLEAELGTWRIESWRV